MARRRLESAVQAGRIINQESDWQVKLGSGDYLKQVVPQVDKEGVFSLQYSYDGQFLACGYGNAGAEILNAETGEVIKTAVKSRYGGLPITALRFNPKKQCLLYAGCSDGTVHVSDIEKDDGSKVIIEEKGNEINCMDFSRDGFHFATAGKDLAVRIYDTGTGKLTRKFDGFAAASHVSEDGVPNAHTSRIFALRWHPEYDHIFVSAGWDDSVKIWDSRSSTGVVRYIAGPHICGDGLDVRGFKIVTGSWKGQEALQIWDYSEGKLLQTLPFEQEAGGEGEFLYCAQYVSDTCVAAGGSGTNNVQIVDTQTNTCLGKVQLEKPVQALDTTLGGARVAVGGGDSIIKMVSIA